MTGRLALAGLVVLAGCGSVPEMALTDTARSGTPTDRLVLRSLQLGMAQELAADCPQVDLSPTKVAAWEEAILDAYQAELALNADQVPDRFSTGFERIGQQAPALTAEYRASRGLGAPPHNPETACRVIALERTEKTGIGQIFE